MPSICIQCEVEFILILFGPYFIKIWVPISKPAGPYPLCTQCVCCTCTVSLTVLSSMCLNKEWANNYLSNMVVYHVSNREMES